MHQKPIISIKEARKILSQEAVELSDDDIEDIIVKYEELASYGLRIAQVRKSVVV
jgi:hypothetical protein